MNPTPHGPGERYERVRTELVLRGYLDGRIQRFILGDKSGGGAAFLAPLRTVAKAAIVGGLPLGALFAFSVLATHRPQAGVADLPLLWVYFTLVASIVLLLLIAAVVYPLTAFARRYGAGALLPTVGGLVAAAPVLVYLTLLWTRHGDAISRPMSLLLLGSSLAATLLVGWLGAIVTVAGIAGRTGQVPRRRRRAVLLMLCALLPLALAIVLLRADSGSVASRAPAEFEVAARAPRITVIGIDGLGRRLLGSLDPGAGAGSLIPGRAALRLSLESGPEVPPAEVWTTLLTGVPTEVHGVRGAGVELLPGVSTPLALRSGLLPLSTALSFLLPLRTIPLSGSERAVRTVWEISALRQRTAALNWWSSWPAGEGNPGGFDGYVISDRVLAKLISGAAADRDTFPQSMFGRLAGEFPGLRDRLRHEFDARFAQPDDGVRVRQILWESFLIDAFGLELLDRLRSDPSVAASFLYLPGLEILQHRMSLERAARESLVDLVQAQSILTTYLDWLRDRLEPLLVSGPGRLGVVLSHPGRGRAGAADAGFVELIGVAGRDGCERISLSVLDVTPTLLALMGFPTSAEMPGRVPADCLEFPVSSERVETFGRRDLPRGRVRDVHDPELVERLRSLGYLN